MYRPRPHEQDKGSHEAVGPITAKLVSHHVAAPTPWMRRRKFRKAETRQSWRNRHSEPGVSTNGGLDFMNKIKDIPQWHWTHHNETGISPRGGLDPMNKTTKFWQNLPKFSMRTGYVSPRGGLDPINKLSQIWLLAGGLGDAAHLHSSIQQWKCARPLTVKMLAGQFVNVKA